MPSGTGRQMTAALTLAALAACTKAKPDRFDLACHVTASAPGQTPMRRDTHFRIDLARKLYCQDDCSEARPIASVSDHTVTLDDEPAGDTHLMQRVSRDDGQYLLLVTGGGLNLSADGECAPMPFSGMPEAKF